MRYRRRSTLAIVTCLSLFLILTLSSTAGAEIRYDPATDDVSMPSQDFRDIVAIKVTAQEQVTVLVDELATSRSETEEALILYQLSADLNRDQGKKITRLNLEVKTWKAIAGALALSHLFR